jgi:hypothetical protein
MSYFIFIILKELVVYENFAIISTLFSRIFSFKFIIPIDSTEYSS